MALTLLMMTAAPAQLQTLLNELSGNILPEPPSIWPLAMGYWIIIFTACAILVAGIIQYRKQKDWRWVKRELNTLAQHSNQSEQLHRLHIVLHWVLQNKTANTRPLGNQAFEDCICATLKQTSPPPWVNAHYQRNHSVDIHWPDVHALLKAWRKEACK